MTVVLGLMAFAPAAAEPAVVATIKPIHSLTAAVMAGIGKPTLLIEGAQSEHSYSLRPSDAAALDRADIVFWIGPALETFLERPLRTLAGRATIIALSEAPGVRLLEARDGSAWKNGASGGRPERRARTAYNMHLWLDPLNAIAMTGAIVEALGRSDPENAPRYRENGERLRERLVALDESLGRELAAVRDIPYVVFHDAYPYLEARYGLDAVGAIQVSTARAAGAKHLSDIRAKIRETGARCVFSEPQFDASLVETVIEGTGAATGVLDPTGAALPAGPDAYFTLLRNLAGSLRGCLAPTR